MSESTTERNATPAQPVGARRRPAVRMVLTRERDWRSTAASVLLHVIVIALVFMPNRPDFLFPDDEGAGGAGPAGGGGGGHRGTGGSKTAERVQFYVQVPVAIPQIAPPVVEKKPEPVPPPPVVEPPPPVEPPKPDSAVTTTTTAEVKAATTGTGGGSGSDSTDGSGPGRGGGVGTGVGTGRGSAEGPGTGGGSGTTYSASPVMLVLPPQPVPARARPYDGRACFFVDSLARVRLLYVTPTKDANYTKKLEESLRTYKFRPAFRLLEGMPVPVADTACVSIKAG